MLNQKKSVGYPLKKGIQCLKELCGILMLLKKHYVSGGLIRLVRQLTELLYKDLPQETGLQIGQNLIKSDVGD